MKISLDKLSIVLFGEQEIVSVGELDLGVLHLNLT